MLKWLRKWFHKPTYAEEFARGVAFARAEHQAGKDMDELDNMVDCSFAFGVATGFDYGIRHYLQTHGLPPDGE